MTITWTTLRYDTHVGTADRDRQRDYFIEIVRDLRGARGTANCRVNGRHFAPVGASSSTIGGTAEAAATVFENLKRMCAEFEETVL